MAHVTLTTDVKNFNRNTLTSATSGTPNRVLTTTLPAANNSAVFGGSLNYIKLKLLSTGSTAPTFYVFGWSFWSEQMAYVPQLLCSFSTTMAGSTQTAPDGATLREVASYTQITGDCKIYNGVGGTGNGGFVMIDTVGCHYIEVCAVDATATTIHVLSSGL
jgi:hypothetical protein